jgi:3-hydroxymyristoyl/3-hydroxydecanoyl-(acyl carrier protein) dehydratase
MPVFPAVGIVDASLHFVKLVTGKSELQLAGLPNAKFLSPIAAEQNLRIEIKALEEQKIWQLDWKDEPSSKTLATLRLSVI